MRKAAGAIKSQEALERWFTRNEVDYVVVWHGDVRSKVKRPAHKEEYPSKSNRYDNEAVSTEEIYSWLIEFMEDRDPALYTITLYDQNNRPITEALYNSNASVSGMGSSITGIGARRPAGMISGTEAHYMMENAIMKLKDEAKEQELEHLRKNQADATAIDKMMDFLERTNLDMTQVISVIIPVLSSIFSKSPSNMTAAIQGLGQKQAQPTMSKTKPYDPASDPDLNPTVATDELTAEEEQSLELVNQMSNLIKMKPIEMMTMMVSFLKANPGQIAMLKSMMQSAVQENKG